MIMRQSLLRLVFLVCLVALHGSSVDHQEDYWKAKLPNVAMPQAIKDNLHNWHGEKFVMTKAYTSYSNMDTVDDVIGSKELKKISSEKKEHEKLSLRAWLVISHGGVFIEKNLQIGMKLKHEFHNMENVPFMPKDIADSIPFSEEKFAEILDRLSINVESTEARSMKKTLKLCLDIPITDEEKRTCIRSLDTMVDYVVEELETNDVKVFMMDINTNFPDAKEEYVVTKVKKLFVPGNYAIGCHKLSYPYAVYLCHRQQDIGQYSVTLANTKTGAIMDSSAICHNDLYAPDVSALKNLGIQPGEGPICHLYVVDDIIWTRNPNHN